MRKVWVLDTETKGTGAEVVPLEKKAKPAGSSAPVVVREKRRAPGPAEPSAPRTFKVVDALSQQVLAEDVDARATVDVLEQTRSVVDVSVYVWEDKAGKWRRLTLDEKRTLWELRGRGPAR